jgi:uncharacterized protein (UPF0332 family)
MFHAARSLLFLGGMREKSHYCVARYIEHRYAANGMLEHKWVDMLDYYREMRHDDQYDINFSVIKSEAEEAREAAVSFVGRMSVLLASIMKTAKSSH